MSTALRVRGPRLMLCEGEHDRSFFTNLIQERSIQDFQICCPNDAVGGGGVSHYGDFLEALLSAPNVKAIQTILIVADNDDNPTASFQFVLDQIKQPGAFATPAGPRQKATSSTLPSVTVLMLPWDTKLGAVETLCLEAAWNKRPNIRKCIDDYANCSGAAAWPQHRRLKMQMRSTLSALCDKDPNTSLTHAWNAEHWSSTMGCPIPLTDTCFNQVVDYLRNFS